MARTTPPDTSAPDITSVNLDRLLARLEHNLSSPDVDPSLRASSYERNKVGANLEYARTLLLRLEHENAGIKVQSRRDTVKADLDAKRDLIKKLTQRLYELNQLNDDDLESEEDSSEDEDPAANNAFNPAVNASASIDYEGGGDSNQAILDGAANLTSVLRSRRPQAEAQDTGNTSAREALFASRSSADPALKDTETMMTHNRMEQEQLTDSLLSMAKALKESSMQFQSSLKEEEDTLKRAGEGLDKNVQGMDAAGRRMKAIDKLTDPKYMPSWMPWYVRRFIGKYILYIYIIALWVLAFMLVFVGPKFRF